MSLPSLARKLSPSRWRLRHLAALLLGVWIAGLGVAAVQLSVWNDELVGMLLQIRADTVFRTRMAQLREPIPREWYRSKALALLTASDKLQEDGRWMLFLPGSWRPFDDLRERLAARIERAFSELAVETMRRELFHRAAELTGTPQDALTAQLLPGSGCSRPAAAPLAAATAPGSEPPELALAREQLQAIEALDAAVRALQALQDPATVDARPLRVLARYTLGAELPDGLERSAALMRGSRKPADEVAHTMLMAQMQAAARCSMGRAMAALDARLFERDELLAAEAVFSRRGAQLFGPGARPQAHADTVAGLREVVAALDRQQSLLARNDYAWLRSGAAPSLGPAHEALLARMAEVSLLGPEAVDEARRHAGTALQGLRAQFTRALGAKGELGLVWDAGGHRLVLSPARLALREGLVLLLQEPFMAELANRPIPPVATAPLSWDTARLQQIQGVAELRRRFAAESLPRFPPSMRPGIAGVVNHQLAQQVQDIAMESMLPPVAADAGLPFDAGAYREQREQLAKVQVLLEHLGAHGRADQLRALLARDLQERLALGEQTLWQSALFSARTQDFGWWQGEGSPILQAFGVADGLALRAALSQQVAGMEVAAREASTLLPYADASVAATPVVARWAGMLPELGRYRGRAGSLFALERYLLGGAELNRANCLERLADLQPVGAGPDEFGQRMLHIHRALLARCSQLRG